MLKNMKMKFPALKNIKVVCFDFDGTVADSMTALTEIAIDVLTAAYQIEKDMARKMYIETTGLAFEQQLNLMFPARIENVDIAKKFEELKRKKYLDLKPVTGVIEIFSYLREKKYKTVISSSTYLHLIEAFVKKYGIKSDLLLGYQPHFKKGKDHFQFIQMKFDVLSKHICYIGDSINDYKLAKDSDVPFIAKGGLVDCKEFHKLDPAIPFIDNILELKKFL